MKASKHVLKMLAVMSGVLFTHSLFAATPSPVGYWKTIDDVTGKPKSIIKVWETPEHSLVGQVVKLFPSPGKTQHVLCQACSGDNHNQPIVGMVIMKGLTSHEHQWGSGEILDPQNGKTYNCSAKLAENGKRLNVRGYIGMPILGRSQTWERVDLMSSNNIG